VLGWAEVAAALLAGILIGWVARSFWLHVRLRSPTPTAGWIGPAAAPHAPSDPASSAAPSPAAVAPAVPKTSTDADTAGRVIVHLARLGRLGNDEVGRTGFTQMGIGKALDVRQGTLTKVLTRLEAAEVVVVDRRHVQGAPRRLNVYRLTALGESVARDLRRRSMIPAEEAEPGTTVGGRRAREAPLRVVTMSPEPAVEPDRTELPQPPPERPKPDEPRAIPR
jgi:DNA-binding MarR family transcriptional regulator